MEELDEGGKGDDGEECVIGSQRPWGVSCGSLVFTGCHSLNLKPQDVRYFCSLYALTLNLLISYHFLCLPTVCTLWLPYFRCEIEANTDGKRTFGWLKPLPSLAT